MPKPAAILTDFVVENLPGLPVSRRLQITRALLDLTSPNSAEEKLLMGIVRDLDRIERNQRKLAIIVGRRRDQK